MSVDIAIVGAGILGLAHAWSAATRGHRVTVFERDRHAAGASVRNFGMIWPIGQPAGEWHAIALASQERWLELAAAGAIWLNACGSIHVAHRRDEWDVLEEFHARSAELGYECLLLTAAEVTARSPAAKRDGLLGGLFSPSELCVNPRQATRHLPRWLNGQFDVRFHFEAAVQHIEPSANSRWRLVTGHQTHGPFDRVIVCGGTDCRLLFPGVLAHAKLPLCKLQMLKACQQPGGWRLGPHLASGLTLRHYRNFEICRSLAALKQRIAAETPELDRYGIHVMASQNDAGEVILGDSHEYDADAEPFDKPRIDELMLRELQKMMCLPDWTIAERWHGFYLKNPAAPVFEAEPLPGVHVHTGLGGSGMTMSFGLAQRLATMVQHVGEIHMNQGKSRLQAVLFDRAGTTIDYGSRAPVEVFLEIFRRRGVEITPAEARGPMGRAKRAHIADLLQLPRVAEAWRQCYGRQPGDADVQSMYDEFLPLQQQTLARGADVIPGVVEAVAECRRRGLKIGSTTGYTRALMEVVMPIAARGGFRPDVVICADDVPAGRPAPWMNFRAAESLSVFPMSAVVAVDDTPVGIEAGLNAGAWAVAVSQTGNALALSAAEAAALPAAELQARLEKIEQAFLTAGAHHVIRSVADLPQLFDRFP